ncbi:flagellar hook-basal body complex protein FliE [Rhodomicrobium vannielii ATCC 17100]|uniref:Flagellar hook-basal body complex protein FliE n=1 Tax=Rhodomicrobium vannielii (strain ATCC 17100 / DSM 162 / LMG 4299 / NCIMB 10020 / ATH 3.1.1) TaxID=648757 RepID=E3I682_RHOVT|nr:flagellar hook-basal body complex protein FliE [Rhodomicrobium vannielii]ADP71747.1 flagellar hook-basal body complex protein FliE [Rhodomicrobium vannielii ATCC 17100]
MTISSLASFAIFDPSASFALEKKTASAGAATTDFSSVLAALGQQTAVDVKAGESVAAAGLQGRASTQEVVQAVSKAELSLQAALAVRDKAVSAYQELTRMTI